MLKHLRPLACLLALAAPARAGTLLTVTDLHFNPMDAPPLTDSLAGAPAEKWGALLSPGTGLGQFGADPGWPLVRSALNEMQRREPHPDVIAVLGDLLAHEFRERFNHAVTDHSDAAYRAFVTRTVAFLADELAQRFPGTPILPVIGNNDDDCGDYAVEPGGPFFADTLPVVQRLVGAAADPGLADTWRATGSYVAHLGPHLRAIALNTVFFSRHYHNTCGDAAATPTRAVMDFLANALAAAQQAGDKVWLLYHIPPGADAYGTLHASRAACPGGEVPMWPDALTKEFAALMHRYRDTVAAGFAGHTHMDEFRLIGSGDAPDAFTLVTPGISPIFGQNPGFARYTTTADGRLLDRALFYLANLKGTQQGENPDWRQEYEFSQAWLEAPIDAASLAAIDRRIGHAAADEARWQRFFSVSRPEMWAGQSGSPAPDAAALRAYWCTEHTVDPEAFVLCRCAGKDD
jgi:hypothetical protein